MTHAIEDCDTCSRPFCANCVDEPNCCIDCGAITCGEPGCIDKVKLMCDNCDNENG